MTEAIYRFQVHYPAEKGRNRGVKFVADMRTPLHPDFRFRIEALIAMRSRQIMRFQYSQREVFAELWNAWELENKKLAASLPAKFPQRWQALKELRQKEHGRYGNPLLLLELWGAWCRRFPQDAQKIEREFRKLPKIAPATWDYRAKLGKIGQVGRLSLG
jgi:hypothetical protein